jgi:hypothetical protein
MISYGDIFKALDKMEDHLTDAKYRDPDDRPRDYETDENLEYEISRQNEIDGLAAAITDQLVARIKKGEFNA